MKPGTAFSEIVNLARPGNVKQLKKRMWRASRLAKNTIGGARRRLYEIKHDSVSRLLTMDAARVNSFVTWPEPLLGLDLEGGGRIHIRPAGLSLEAMEVVVQQLEKMVRTEVATTSQLGKVKS